MPSRSTSCQSEISGRSSAISASVTRGESRRQATHRSADNVLIARTSPSRTRRPSREGRATSFVAFGFLPARMLRALDAFFRNFYALDALEAEERFDEVRRRLGGDQLDDCPESLLHVLAEGDALDREGAQVHLDALVGLKHAGASARQLRYGIGEAEPSIRHHGIPSSRLDGIRKDMVDVAGGLCNGGIEGQPRADGCGPRPPALVSV